MVGMHNPLSGNVRCDVSAARRQAGTAQGDETVVVKGSRRFPPDSNNYQCFRERNHRTRCPWKARVAWGDVRAVGGTGGNAS